MSATLKVDGKKTVRENFELFNPVMVVPCEDQRAAELVALYNRADERGKSCLLAMARCLPCMREA